MKNFTDGLKENIEILYVFIIFAITVILTIGNFNINTDIFFDDGIQHISRAYETFKAIFQRENSNVIAEYANGFGYSWNLFYGPLSTYIIMVFGVIFKSFNFGLKIVESLIVFFAGFFMYKFMYSFSQNRNTALLSSVIYITSPYFFTDIYTRHAIGEAFAFVFVPLLFLGLYNLFNTEDNTYYLTLGAVGLILSHNISSVLSAFFALQYCIMNFRSLGNTRVKRQITINLIFILSITAFFWVALLQTKFSADYRVYEKDAMTTEEIFNSEKLNLKDLLITSSGETNLYEIGFSILVMLPFFIMGVTRIEKNRKDYIFYLICGFISLWMTTKYFPWGIFKFLYIIQFPWRLLLFSTFFFSIVCAINMEIVIKHFNFKDVLIICIISLIYIYSRSGIIQYNPDILKIEDCALTTINGQNDMSYVGMGKLEYLPSKAYNNLFYIASRDEGADILSGQIEIKDQMKFGNYFYSKINNYDEESIIELPYIYYPGFTVRLDGIVLDNFETENGFVGCKIEPNENGSLEVKYTGTNLMNFAKIISVIGCIGLIIYVWKKH